MYAILKIKSKKDSFLEHLLKIILQVNNDQSFKNMLLD